MSVTIEEYEKWIINKNINQKTGKKITNSGKIYKQYEKLDIKKLYVENCINDIDPISLNYLWKLENNKKIIIHNNLDNIIFYKDIKGKIRFLEKESLSYMKGYNITKDPITQEELPKDLFDNIEGEKIINEEEKTLEQLAFDIFQLFTKISIFIDHSLFLNLNKSELLKLHYETSDFYKNNFSKEQQEEISIHVFKKDNDELNLLGTDKIKKYLLNQYKILLEQTNENYKFMINYILVGGLSLVIRSVKKDYPQYAFDF